MSLEVVHSRVILVRHGHYERIGEEGDTVWGLTPLGRRQAVRTGRRQGPQTDPGALHAAGCLSGGSRTPRGHAFRISYLKESKQ